MSVFKEQIADMHQDLGRHNEDVEDTLADAARKREGIETGAHVNT